ncbi:MAG: copper ion binding protein [Absicoccus sp.]|uniref:heavy-metal-associated domain-containing protein n=1 Tax=Absicoccus sp. TaxID=2718527 RepID=UPI002A74A821|nr:copper ion binding protein [Absicoccus sp.]MDY3035535.1 copper ion binding protein [Absicoccus sp.]
MGLFGKKKKNTEETNEKLVNKTMLIEGMACNHCAATVHHALVRVPGVKEANVDITKGTAAIQMAEGTSLVELKQAVSDAGYEPVGWQGQDQKHSLQVPDMMCEHCVATITEAVKNVEGTSNVQVDLDTKTVSFNANKPTFSKAVEAIIAAGYHPE